jgi:RNA polymerase primary sigma factor
MASSPKVTPQKDKVPEKGGSETPPDSPLLGLSDAAVKKLIRTAKKRGYVTHDQIDSLSKEVNSKQIQDVLAMFSEMGVNVVETEEPSEEGEEQREEPDEEGESGKLVEVQQKVPAKSEAKEPTERTDDPVRMYLREMGSVELLSREGEIAIAKRIEAGREAMIAGLCESPLTFQAIIIWRDELNEGKVFLRDIIDLEATYAGPDAKAMPAPVIGPDGQPIVAPPGAPPVPGSPVLAPPPASAGATPFKGAPERANGEEGEGGETPPGEGDFDDDDMENSLSLAAIEAQLKSKVVETFDNIADAYKRLRRLQDQDIQNKLRNDSLSPVQERRYKKLKDDIIAEVKSLRLNQARIDSLVEQLYDINKRLVGYEGRLMRLAESHGVAREDFLCPSPWRMLSDYGSHLGRRKVMLHHYHDLLQRVPADHDFCSSTTRSQASGFG